MADKNYDPTKDPRVKYSDDKKSAVIELDEEVPRGPKDEPLREVTVHRPTVGEMESADRADGNVGGSILVVASITSLPVAIVKRIDFADFQRISDVIEGFGGKGPATGAVS